MYQEGPDSRFRHEGKTYSVDKLLAIAANLPVVDFPVIKLAWMIDDNYDVKRMRAADTNVPVIIYHLPEGAWVTLDGYHRTIKAFYVEKRKTIPAKIFSDKQLQQL